MGSGLKKYANFSDEKLKQAFGVSQYKYKDMQSTFVGEKATGKIRAEMESRGLLGSYDPEEYTPKSLADFQANAGLVKKRGPKQMEREASIIDTMNDQWQYDQRVKSAEKLTALLDTYKDDPRRERMDEILAEISDNPTFSKEYMQRLRNTTRATAEKQKLKGLKQTAAYLGGSGRSLGMGEAFLINEAATGADAQIAMIMTNIGMREEEQKRQDLMTEMSMNQRLMDADIGFEQEIILGEENIIQGLQGFSITEGSRRYAGYLQTLEEQAAAEQMARDQMRNQLMTSAIGAVGGIGGGLAGMG